MVGCCSHHGNRSRFDDDGSAYDGRSHGESRRHVSATCLRGQYERDLRWPPCRDQRGPLRSPPGRDQGSSREVACRQIHGVPR